MEYYTRIFQKKYDESEEDFEKRIRAIKEQLPQLTIWMNDLYKNYITTVDTDPESEITITTTSTKKRLPSRRPTSEAEVSYQVLS